MFGAVVDKYGQKQKRSIRTQAVGCRTDQNEQTAADRLSLNTDMRCEYE